MFKKLLTLGNIGVALFIMFMLFSGEGPVGAMEYYVTALVLANIVAILKGYTEKSILAMLALGNAWASILFFSELESWGDISYNALIGAFLILFLASTWRFATFTGSEKQESVATTFVAWSRHFLRLFNHLRKNMYSKFLALEQSTRNKIIAGSVIGGALLLAFYWYSYRPMAIKKECSTVIYYDSGEHSRDASDQEYKTCLRKNGVDY